MNKLFSLLLIFFFSSATLTAQVRYAGGDISMLPEYEQHNSPYKDQNGKNLSNLLDWLVDDCHWNTFRVRLFVNPTNPNGDGVLQDLDYVKTLGRRIKDKGAYFMLDFHYSDTWVDATHIQAPAAWQGLSDSLMADTLGKYTAMVLDTLIANGATPDLVQVGNEIMYGLCGIQVHPYNKAGDNWAGYAGLLRAGCNAVRTHCPNAKIIIHTDRPTNDQYNLYFYQKLIDLQVDYDVIGLSYYPFWHGYLTDTQVASKSDKNNLGKALSSLARLFPDKEVQIVETAYNFQYWPTAGVNYDTQDAWPCSVTGQYNFIRDLVAELSQHPNVTGISYWFPEEAGNGDDTNWSTSKGTVLCTWLNRGLWNEQATQSGHALNKVSATQNVPMELGKYAQPATAVESQKSQVESRKRIENGHVLIERAGVVYDILGNQQ